ncbi:hypothetical protein [Xanthomonas citri]|uniref:hypothetical protein n=1 Tax=Xanthomonas citri TaxID=346 RepID=UPI00168D086A|nr:hypothetical protein [Xanthomonas citri]MBE0314182.1 hypothetical protein [Xanthomonas citri pv. punicae]
MVEGVFIKILGGKEGVSGFHATFYVMANNAQNAVHRVGPLVVNRMAVHGISATAGVFGTYYFVRDIWEVVSGNFSQDNEGDLGFPD